MTDERGGHNRSELTTWVSGAGTRPSTAVEQEALTVVPDKAEYAPGDTAEVLVQAPFANGEGLLTVSRNGLGSTEHFTIDNGSAVLTVPITEADLPSLTLGIEVVGQTTRIAADGTPLADVPARPAYATGGLTLPVSLASRTLTVAATPRDEQVLPGGSTTIDVSVTDSSGRPVEGAEFAVVVVDEAVLALTGYNLPDPLAAFYGGWYEYASAYYSRGLIRLLDNDLLDGSASRTGSDDTETAAESTVPAEAPADMEQGGSAADEDKNAYGEDGGANTPIEVRSQFDALALFEPSVTTDGAGKASIPLTLPDNLTRYRIMVVAVAGDDAFGSAESDITARLPLSVRPSAPRFANFGDSFELPVVVQNQGDTALDVDVVLETANLSPTAPMGRTVSVPANGRVCLLYTSPSPRDRTRSRMPSSA